MTQTPEPVENPIIPPPDVDADDPTRHAAPLNAKRLIRSTLVVMIGFLATKLVSLGQVVILADRFGTSSDQDTYVAASLIPDNIIRLIGVGAVSVAFIPLFSGLLNRRDGAGAWRLASQVFNTMLIISLVLGTIVLVMAPLLVHEILAPGFSDGEVKQTVELMRILLITVMIFPLSSLFTGVLNGHNHFLLPVLAPIFYDLGLLFGVIVFTGPFGIYGVAWGTVLGALLHFSIQVPGLFRFKAKWSPILGWKDPQLRHVVRLLIPRILASGLFAINLFAISNIASRLGEGAISAFGWGVRIMDIPEALIGTAMAFVIFPSLAALTELGDVEQRRKMFSQAVRFILVGCIPAGAGMILIGRPAVQILFTDPDEARLVYAVVQVMGVALVFQAVHEVVTRAFYAMKDTMTPLIVSAIATVATVLVIVTGYLIYDNVDGISLYGPLGVGGPAIGYLVSFMVELGLMFVILKRRWQDVDESRIRTAITRTLAATALMAIPVFLVDYALAHSIFEGTGRIAGLARAGVGGILGGVFFLIGALIFKVEEVRQLPDMLRRGRGKESAPITPEVSTSAV
ncbi:MAG: lipid II flippase MurJ [Chloroflexota bacterium]|nr:murein biosynthesis integral membrane protein MurJ [Chloroflexota bacterium]NOG63398.1 murein biosynthesis integral membrane protein MurJ [Chloroflexota bacterium]GIK62258.1 MAG: lipid II flippase MurJ [Chloroflexota bacterium]